MIQRRLAPLLTLVALSACNEDSPAGEALSVPSGREISLIEVISNAPGNEGATARFRFLAPGLSPDEVESTVADMQALCDAYALPRIEGMVPAPQQIVISLSAEPVPFGAAAPDVVQFFEIYRPEAGACIWEPF
ncbi:MAG: DUF6497 family protein [Tabrizicola sp.]|jgi:hypothetical protein|nr:DUF6497 family protein [Tabrizicola sp.]